MKPLHDKKSILVKKLQKVQQTPASFAFFVAIHDFVECIELIPSFASKLTRDTKYIHLKQIHRGIKDVSLRADSGEDLGHDRYMNINDLNRIQKNEMSENNSFWKKREVFRKLTLEVYERLSPQPAQPAHAKK